MTPRLTHIAAAAGPEDLAAVADLFRAYAQSLPIDLDAHGFGDELAGLPGAYVPPDGGLWLARGAGGVSLGCVALRPLPGPGLCELKRLYLRPEARGTGLGRALTETAIAAARARGYTEMRLDTLPSLTAAVALYESLGFRAIADYYGSPYPGTLFFSLAL